MDFQKGKSHGTRIKIGFPSIYASVYHYHIDGIKIGPYRDKVWKSSVLTFTFNAKFARSKEDSQHISGLKDEITLLKTFIMESYNNLTELRRNESRAGMETKYQPNDSDDGDCSAPASSPHSDDDQETGNLFSSSDDEPRPPNDDQETSMGVHQNASPQTDKCRNNRVEILPSTRNDTKGGSIHRESNLLLQMVPYRPNFPRPIQSDRLLPAVLGRDGSKTSTSKGPTESVRHLLDKWTLSGSAPISTILDEESPKEEEEEEEDEPSV